MPLLHLCFGVFEYAREPDPPHLPISPPVQHYNSTSRSKKKQPKGHDVVMFVEKNPFIL